MIVTEACGVGLTRRALVDSGDSTPSTRYAYLVSGHQGSRCAVYVVVANVRSLVCRRPTCEIAPMMNLERRPNNRTCHLSRGKR
jgi:hypothetical protein